MRQAEMNHLAALASAPRRARGLGVARKARGAPAGTGQAPAEGWGPRGQQRRGPGLPRTERRG